MMLNREQKAAVEAPGGPQLILAGAGSGKTRTIVYRIGHLIANMKIAPHRILAVTFTNKAAAELQHRLNALIGDGGGGVLSGTFHSISLRFLRRYGERLGYASDFQVIGSDDQRVLAKRVLKANNLSPDRIQPGYLLAWIEQCKNAGLDARHAPEETWRGVALNQLYRAYQDELLKLQRMDFGDLLLNALRLFREHEDVASILRSRFDHVLVDEYQDINPAQHEWLIHLCKEHRNITVVGDDDQSIYGWRGADVGHILDFSRHWPGATVHRLQANYRSTGAILALANAVIRNIPHRHEKRLLATRHQGEIPRFMVCVEEYDEARKVAAYLRERRQGGVDWRDMAILFRTLRQSLPIEQVLREMGIPYRMIGGLGFFERMEVKDALAYWAILHQCGDALHLLRICNKPKRGIGVKGEEAIREALVASGLPVHAWLQQLAQTEVRGALSKLKPLALTLERIRPKALKEPDLGLGLLLEETGYLKSLGAHGQLEAESRMENIRTLQDFIERSAAEGLSPMEFMDRAALLQSGEEAREENAVSLMSLHRAKGLEFDSVVLVGVEEGLIPHQRSLDEGERGVHEECRLLYVGITRAKNSLRLTTCRMRRNFGELVQMRPSRFIANVDAALLLREDRNQAEPSMEQPATQGMHVGARVRHPTFGMGTVLTVEGQGDALRVSVRFTQGMVKKLMVKYAALEVI